MKTNKPYYVVWQGHRPGVYDTWTECKAQITGFDRPQYKKFSTRYQAFHAYQKGSSYRENLRASDLPVFEKKSILINASTDTQRNLTSYYGLYLNSNRRMFSNTISSADKRIGLFLAAVKALSILHKHRTLLPVYTESLEIISAVKDKRFVALNPQAESAKVNLYVRVALAWLEKHPPPPLLHWNAAYWGELPIGNICIK